jgi:hypothetical protein
MSSEQIEQIKQIEQIEQIECPICYDQIENDKNCVTTDCGHKFHCSCLMKNSAVNGFSCPMCRQIMADQEEDEEDEDDESEYDDEIISDDALTSFRMFNQRLDGEDVEDEEEQDLEDEEQEQEQVVKPTPEYIAAKLTERGVSMEDLVRSLLIEHAEYDEEEEHNRKADQIFGAFRAIISRFQHENI